MPEVPALSAHQIRDLLQIQPGDARNDLAYTVVGSESVPTGVKHSRRAVVRDYEVEFASVFFNLRQPVGHLFIRRLLLRPPGAPFGTIPLVDARRPAEAPEPLARDCVDVPSPPQMEHRWADYPDRASAFLSLLLYCGIREGCKTRLFGGSSALRYALYSFQLSGLTAHHPAPYILVSY